MNGDGAKAVPACILFVNEDFGEGDMADYLASVVSDERQGKGSVSAEFVYDLVLGRRCAWSVLRVIDERSIDDVAYPAQIRFLFMSDVQLEAPFRRRVSTASRNSYWLCALRVSSRSGRSAEATFVALAAGSFSRVASMDLFFALQSIH